MLKIWEYDRLRLTILFLAGTTLLLIIAFTRHAEGTHDFNKSKISNYLSKAESLQKILALELELFKNQINGAEDGGIDVLNHFKKTNQAFLSDSVISNEQLFIEFQKSFLNYQNYLLTNSEKTNQESLTQVHHEYVKALNKLSTDYIQQAIIYKSKSNEAHSDTFENLLGILIATAIISLVFVLIILRHYHKKVAELTQKWDFRQNEEQKKIGVLNYLLDSINVGIWEKQLDTGSENLSANFYKILGLEPNSIPATGEEFIKRLHPDDRALLNDASNSSIITGKASTVELRVKTPQGYKWVEATGNVRKDAYGKIDLLIGGIIDINNRKILEQQIKLFVEHAPAPIAMFDQNMKFLLISDEWIKTYELHDKIIIGKSYYEIFPHTADKWKERHKECLGGKVLSMMEDSFEREDGSNIWLNWEMRPWYKDSTTIGGVILFTQNVTQFRKQKEELEAAKIAAEQASKAKQEFLATMSHEIRTPLNAINGVVHILQTENPRPDQQEHLSLLKFSSENLLNLINNILDITKIQSGKLELEKRAFGLEYMIKGIINTLKHRADEHLTSLSIEYDKNIPEHLLGDPTRITQILLNLVGNAIKFTKNGSIKLRCQLISQSEEQNKIRVSVKDTGVGIAPQNLKKVFDPFSQEDSSTTREFGGTGLGLYISRNLLINMGSDLLVESQKALGSTFYFDIDLATAEDHVSDASYNESIIAEYQRYHALIVEDNIANQLILKKFLSYINISSDVANNGLEALEMLKIQQYHIVFLDLQMPVMDGHTTIQHIRKLKESYYQDLPVIALTADSFQDIKDQVMSLGMSDFLGKPYKSQDLYDVINKHIGKLHVPVAQQSDIARIIMEEAAGDEEFSKSFAEASRTNYIEFLNYFKEIIVSKDVAHYRRMVHKIKALNIYFELEEFQSKLDRFDVNNMDNELAYSISEHALRIISDLEKLENQPIINSNNPL